MYGEGSLWTGARREAVTNLAKAVNDVCFLLRNSMDIDYGADMAEILSLRMENVIAFEVGGELAERARALVKEFSEKQAAQVKRRIYRPEPGEKTPTTLRFEEMAEAERGERAASFKALTSAEAVESLRQLMHKACLDHDEMEALLKECHDRPNP